MQLTETQQNSVRQWAAAGATLAEIQTRLTEEFAIRMSFMDVRLLILDLEVSIREKRSAEAAKPKAAEPDPEAEGPSGGEDEAMDEEELPPEEAVAPPGGGVQVEVSRLAQPGFALNGDVTFSDGAKAQWGITSRGELSLSAADPAYRPSPGDIRDFQMKLRNLVSRQGY